MTAGLFWTTLMTITMATYLSRGYFVICGLLDLATISFFNMCIPNISSSLNRTLSLLISLVGRSCGDLRWFGYVECSDWMAVRGYFAGEGEMLRFGLLVPGDDAQAQNIYKATQMPIYLKVDQDLHAAKL